MMSKLTLKDDLVAVQYDGFNEEEVTEFANDYGWNVYRSNGSTNGHADLVVHAALFFGDKTVDKYDYLCAGDWLVGFLGTVMAVSDAHIRKHVSGLSKKQPDLDATHEGAVVTNDEPAEDAPVVEPEHNVVPDPFKAIAEAGKK